MAIILNENERLLFAQMSALRAPDGTPLPAEPLYIIVDASAADPALIVELKENERLILAGVMLNDMQSARERYAALQKGQEPPPHEKSVPLYKIIPASAIDRKTQMTEGERKMCDSAADAFIDVLRKYTKSGGVLPGNDK